MNYSDLPPDVKEALDHKKDEVEEMSPQQIFDEYCDYQGLIHWGNKLWNLAFLLNDLDFRRKHGPYPLERRDGTSKIT